MDKCSGIILAAGNGERTTEQKQFAMLGGLPMFLRVNKSMEQSEIFDEIQIVFPPDKVNELNEYVKGGETRLLSIYEGLKACRNKYIIIHDAARPYTPPKAFYDVWNLLKGQDRPVATMQRVHDTVFHVGDMKWDYFDRDLIRRIQTPNGFTADLMREVLEEMIRHDEIDKPAIYGYLRKGIVPIYYQEDFFNEKITTESELEHARKYF